MDKCKLISLHLWFKFGILYMLEKQIQKIIAQKNMRPVDVYRPLKINRINFYKAIKTSNLENKSLKKILIFLGYELLINLNKKS